MTDRSVSIKIGGAAGQGVQTVSGILSTVLTRSGYYVFSVQSYESRIRGGHTFTLLRAGNRQFSGAQRTIDILVCLTEETYHRHVDEVRQGGIVVGRAKDRV